MRTQKRKTRSLKTGLALLLVLLLTFGGGITAIAQTANGCTYYADWEGFDNSNNKYELRFEYTKLVREDGSDDKYPPFSNLELEAGEVYIAHYKISRIDTQTGAYAQIQVYDYQNENPLGQSSKNKTLNNGYLTGSFNFTAIEGTNVNVKSVLSAHPPGTGTPSITNMTICFNYLGKGVEEPKEYTVATSADPAAGGDTTGDGTYDEGDEVTVTATANEGYSFVNWTEDSVEVSTASSYTFNIEADRVLVANFEEEDDEEPIEYTVTTSADPEAGGDTTGDGTYDEGDEVTVTATAKEGYSFVNWTEEGVEVSTSSSYTFNIEADRVLVANFEEDDDEEEPGEKYVITTSSTPPAGGSTSGGGTFDEDEEITVTATANSGYTFARWQEDGTTVSTNASYTFTVTLDRDLVAVFTLRSTGGGGGGSNDDPVEEPEVEEEEQPDEIIEIEEEEQLLAAPPVFEAPVLDEAPLAAPPVLPQTGDAGALATILSGLGVSLSGLAMKFRKKGKDDSVTTLFK